MSKKQTKAQAEATALQFAEAQANRISYGVRKDLGKAWQDLENMLTSVIFNAYTDNWISFFVVKFDVSEYGALFSGKPIVATIRMIEYTDKKRNSFYVGKVLVNMAQDSIVGYQGFNLEFKQGAIKAIRKAHKHSMSHRIAWSDEQRYKDKITDIFPLYNVTMKKLSFSTTYNESVES